MTSVSGLLVCLLGFRQPWLLFALCILPASIAGGCLRPGSANMMLEQQKGDTGEVSSLMGCTSLLMGSLGLQLISIPWSNTIVALGVMTMSTALISLVAWLFVIRRAVRLPGTIKADAPNYEYAFVRRAVIGLILRIANLYHKIFF